MHYLQILCASHLFAIAGTFSYFTCDDVHTSRLTKCSTYAAQKIVSPENVSFVTAITFSRDGKMLAIGEANGVISLWNIDKNILIFSENKHTKSISGLAISPDSSMVISAGEDHVVLLWDASNGNLIDMHSTNKYQINSIDISTDNQYLLANIYIYRFPLRNAFHDPRGIIFSEKYTRYRVWDIRSGKIVYDEAKLDDQASKKYKLDRDKNKIKVEYPSDTSQNEIILYQRLSGEMSAEPYFRLKIGPYSKDDISNDGKIIAITKLHGIVDLWNTQKKSRIAHLISNIQNINTMKLSDDYTKLAICGDSSLMEIWDLSDIKNPTVKHFDQQKQHEIVDGKLKVIITKKRNADKNSFFTTIKRKKEDNDAENKTPTWTTLQEFTPQELPVVKKLLEQASNWISQENTKQRR